MRDMIMVRWETTRRIKTKNSRTVTVITNTYHRFFGVTDEELEKAKKFAQTKLDKGYPTYIYGEGIDRYTGERIREEEVK